MGRLAGGMKDWAMLMAMEMTLAKENRGWVWGGHMLGCWATGGDMVTLSLLPGLGVSLRGLGELGAGEETEGKVGLLATRVRGGWWAGFGEPGEPGYGNGK